MIFHKQQIVVVTCMRGQESLLHVFELFEVNDTFAPLYSVCAYVHTNVFGKALVFAWKS